MPPEERGTTEPEFTYTQPAQAVRVEGGTQSRVEAKLKDTEDEPYDDSFEDPPFSTVIATYLGLSLLVLFGHFRDLLRRWGFDKTQTDSKEGSNEGFVPLYNDFEAFYTRNVYQRVCHYWNYPLAGVPGSNIEIWDREFGNYNEGVKLKNTKKGYLNIGSYNYLGFAENDGSCSRQTIEEIRSGAGVGIGSSRSEFGTLDIHRKLEARVAQFVGKDDALVFGMGFGTNALNIPAFIEQGCLLISDELNHTSLILGARLSGAKISVFKHNDMKHLEHVLRKNLTNGQPRTHRPWKKIIIVVEGVYSMEGTCCKLAEIVALKKKYKAYLYVDEAHSIGALGATGRGICEHYNVSPGDVDILMGTFSKSFGAAGGYIAADRTVIAHLKRVSHAQSYATSLSPPVCRQVLASMESIMGLDGTDDGIRRIKQLANNTRYFRRELKRRGYIIYGEKDSPVVPMLLFSIANICAFAKEALNRGLATVIVGFPATPILGSRARFCMSASHTREDLDRVLKVLEEMEQSLGLKMSRRHYKKAINKT